MVALIDTNFGLHANRIPGQTSGMQVYHSPSLSYVDSGLSCDTFNIIHIKQGHTLSAQELEGALIHFKQYEQDYCLWINSENLLPRVEKLLLAHGLRRQHEEIGMILRLENYQAVLKETHANIKLVSNAHALEEYATVIANNWNPPDANVLDYYKKTSQSYLAAKEEVFFLTYYHKDRAVATAELFSTDQGTLGIYGFATLAAYRGRGIGSTLFTYALNLAKEKGFKNLILQATEDGIGIYKNYGFKTVTTYFEYA